MALPTSLDTERSVLFLGSGFSAEASAISGSRPPLGIELANILADALGQERGKYSLQQLADAVQRDVRLDLFEIVRPHFIISNLSANQREILRHRWMRIYTTNYDDTVELAYQKTTGRLILLIMTIPSRCAYLEAPSFICMARLEKPPKKTYTNSSFSGHSHTFGNFLENRLGTMNLYEI
jgi:hypothetical protein